MKMKFFQLLAVTIALILVVAITVTSAAVLFSDDFEDGNYNGLSKNGGSWSVVTDGTRVFKQSSISATAYAYTGSSSWNNYSVQARIKPLTFNGAGRPTGVIARFQSTSNFYYAVLKNNNTLELGKKVGGSMSALASKSFTVNTGTWYTIRLTVNGSQLQCYVNGNPELSASDSAFASGRIGLYAYNTAVEFDDIIVESETGGPTSTPTPTTTTTPTPTPTVTTTPTPTPTDPDPTPIASIPVIGGPIGWASVNYLGQNGTTGGAGGPEIHVYDKATLENVLYKDDNPAIVVIHGTLTGGPGMVNVKSNKTIIGAGNGAYLNFGFYLRGNNIIIKNLDIMNGGFEAGDSEGLDAVSFAQDVHHVWIDHCTMHETRDGLVDPTRNARFVTISYCHFYYQKTAVLIGASDSDSAAAAAQSSSDKRDWHYTVTLHHNYWQNVYERCPRVRFGAVHVFNNYYDNNPNYAIGRGDLCNIYSEANYFLNTHDAFAAYDDSSHRGYIEDVDSLFEGDNGNTQDNPPSGSWVWHPSQYYSYTSHSAQWVKLNLKNYVGIGKGNP